MPLNTASVPTEIIILRNSNSEQFYIVKAGNELFIVSTKESLKILDKISNVDEFTVDDSNCSGQIFLRVKRKDDAVPLIFDDNFKNRDVLFSHKPSSDPLPLVNELKRKYIEAQYSVKNYEKSIQELVKLRHEATLLAYHSLHPNHGDSVFKSVSQVYGALKIKTQKPWVKVCNKKAIISLNVLNEYKEPLEGVHLLLNSATSPSLTYITKLFENTSTYPFLREKSNQKLLPDHETTVVAVMSLEEIKVNVTSGIELRGALSYKTSKDTFLMPLDDVIISSLDTLGDEFDVLSSSECGNYTSLFYPQPKDIYASTRRVSAALRFQSDITVCTKNGELKEYFQRDILSSMPLNTASVPTEIIILRNSNSEQFYIVKAGNELFIVSTKESLKILDKISNVDEFTVDDSNCSGQIFLRVKRKDDAVPLIFDDNFKNRDVLFSHKPSSDPLPLVNELKRKYIEAQYSVKNYEKSIQELVKLRHEATLLAYHSLHPNHGDSVFKSVSQVYGALKIKTQKPWVKVCNKKAIISLNVLNEYKEPLEGVHLLLNSATSPSLTYITKLFENTSTYPFLREKSNQKLLPDHETTVVAVMSLEEIKVNVTSGIELRGALSYKTSKDTFLMPLDDVIISSLDTLGDEFDVLSSSECDTNTMMAILSSTVKTDLHLRSIRNDTGLLEILMKHLQMERLGPNVIVYKKSPYHALNGTLLHFRDGGTDRAVTVSVYTRTKSQVLALIHYINDAVPFKIVTTTPNYIISAKTPESSQYTEPKPEIPEKDYLGYARTVLNRTAKIIEYLDWSMVKMSESKDPEIVRQIGFQIDLYACGQSGYKEFREKIIEEGENGVKCLSKITETNAIEPMVVD